MAKLLDPAIDRWNKGYNTAESRLDRIAREAAVLGGGALALIGVTLFGVEQVSDDNPNYSLKTGKGNECIYEVAAGDTVWGIVTKYNDPGVAKQPYVDHIVKQNGGADLEVGTELDLCE